MKFTEDMVYNMLINYPEKFNVTCVLNSSSGDIKFRFSDQNEIPLWWLTEKLNMLAYGSNAGEVVVTTNEDGECILVSRQDEDHKILKVIWEKK